MDFQEESKSNSQQNKQTEMESAPVKIKIMKKVVKPKLKIKLVVQEEPTKCKFPTVEELANCYETETAKALDCEALVAHANVTQHYTPYRKYRYIAGERDVMVKINGMMHHITAITFATGWRNVEAVYRDEIDYNDDRDALHFKHYFNIFKMKKGLKGEKTKDGVEKKSNAGCKITRVKHNEDGSVTISLPSTNSVTDLLKFMTNNGMLYADVEYRIKAYDQRVAWIIKGKWDEVDSPEYKAYEARMLKEIKAKEVKEERKVKDAKALAKEEAKKSKYTKEAEERIVQAYLRMKAVEDAEA